MGKERSATAIVIGGGVIGLSTAYQLARQDFGRVILLEKERIGDGASSRAGGIITGLLWTRAGIAARKISLTLFRELSDELRGYGYRFQDVGCLNLFDSASWPAREPLLSLYDDMSVPYELLSAGEIRRRWPELTPADHLVGLHDPLGGYSEPQRYIPALARRCREMGVEFREGQLVSEFVEKNGRAAGVMTREGVIAADVVISTIHTWTPGLLATSDWRLPMKAFVHQRYVTAPLASVVNIPAVNANPQGGYFRPAEGGRILAGIESAERKEFVILSPEFRMSALDAPVTLRDTLKLNLLPLLPRLSEAVWESEQVGLLSFSMDGEPILGELPQLPGLFLGVSFHSGGFAYNPAAGFLLAELALTGRSSIDISSFSPARFKQELTDAYLDQTIPQREAVARRH